MNYLQYNDVIYKSFFNTIVLNERIIQGHNMIENEVTKVKYSIALKLIVIISVLVILSLGTITALVALIVREDVQLTTEESNYTINEHVSNAAETAMLSMRANAFLLMNTLSITGSESLLAEQYAGLFFERNQDIASVLRIANPVSSQIRNDITSEFINNRFFISNELDVSSLYVFLHSISDSIARSANGEIIAVNASSTFGIPTIALLYPWQESAQSESLIILFSSESLSENFGSGSTNTTFMVNDTNDLLIHPDFELMKTGGNMSSLSFVEQMRQNTDTSRQVTFTDENGIDFFGAYTKLPVADVAVITTIETSLVFEAVNSTVYQNIYLSLAVLCVSILFVWFFSRSISKPIKILASASEQIMKGDFILHLKPRSHDEVGLLTSLFTRMGSALETFGRFVNKEIALKAMAGELELGGVTKNATIFFSDIRSFTAISEKLEPNEVIEFLNDYMTRMVACVKDTNGTVDKFIGDAVMAVWGASTTEGSAELDALNGIRASLMMRSALIEFNVGRGGDKKPIIKIGCGLNTGPVVAGQMGSLERMEYTVIGDAVNFASRTETLTKPFGADILITEDTYALVKEHVIVEKMPSVRVKGKEEPVKIYAVVNMPNVTDIKGAGKDGPKTMADVRKMLDIPTPDFDNVDPDAEEKKYKIGDK